MDFVLVVIGLFLRFAPRSLRAWTGLGFARRPVEGLLGVGSQVAKGLRVPVRFFRMLIQFPLN